MIGISQQTARAYCQTFFAARSCEFIKTKHAVEITKWIAEYDPNFFHELKTFLENMKNAPDVSRKGRT